MFKPLVFKLFVQAIALAFSRALLKAGSSIAASIAIIAMTTSSSINVKRRCFIFSFSFLFDGCLCETLTLIYAEFLTTRVGSGIWGLYSVPIILEINNSIPCCPNSQKCWWMEVIWGFANNVIGLSS